jgi:hypothetical protein
MRRKTITIFLLFVFIGLIRTMLPARHVMEKDGVIYPALAQVKPNIDGSLEDETWQDPPLEKDFISYSPLFGEILPYKTRVWMAYDSENLYFAFQCDDPEPQKIKTSLTKRDNMLNDDWVALSLDALGTKQSAYHFFVNPNGIQGDILNSAVTGSDMAPDFVWESASRLTEKGYQVEICIPLKSISFKSGKMVKMGILFMRRISRLGLYGSWPEPKPGQQVFTTHAPLIYKGLKKTSKLELLPAVTHGNNKQRISAEEWGKRDSFTDFGIGLKYGITSSVTAEITVNPDFSQVESDAFQVQVNQRYPLFYSEKRPFFMEGSDIFGFFTIPNGFFPHAVHTRRILVPSWGAKLTGTQGKTTFGILTAGDEWPGLPWESGNNPNQGKQALFGIARGKYSLGKDNYIGFLYSGREFSDESNRVLGADIGYWISKNQRVNASFLHRISGEPAGNKRNFTDSSDFNFLYSYTTKPLEILAAFEHIGTDFSMASSFLMRTGIEEGWGMVVYNFHPHPQKLPWLKRISPMIAFRYLHDLGTHMDDTHLNMGMEFNFIKQGYITINYHIQKESWQGQTFDLDRLNLSGEILMTRWLHVSGALSWGEKIYYEAAPAYKGKAYDASFSLVLQPNLNLNQNFSFSHTHLIKDNKKVYNVNIIYSRTTYQFNKYFFLRAVIQYNSYYKRLLTDFLASFTLIPGTVFHVGYGGLYENRQWQDGNWLYRQGDLLNIKRSFFLKASYLWRF